jgi:hypothetical protein
MAVAVVAGGLAPGFAAQSLAQTATTPADPSIATVPISPMDASTDIVMDPTYTGTTADSGIDDPLHIYFPGFLDNGVNTPINSAKPSNFGFTISPGPKTGDFWVVILVPNNDAIVSGIGITGTISSSGGGTQSVTATASKKPTDWTSNDLSAFLGLSNSTPANPIGAFNCQPASTCANRYDPGLTGFHVYLTDLKTTTLLPASQPNVMPLLSLTQTVPIGTYIVAFMNIGTTKSPTWIATAPSGAGLVTSKVPEPASIGLLATALMGMGILRFRRARRGKVVL